RRASTPRTYVMPSTRSFNTLRDEARQDPERARRIDEAKQRAIDEIVSFRLAELRKALGVTQAELAEMIGKSQSAISQIEHGEIGLSIETLRSIVHQLGGEVEIAAVFDDRRVLIDT
ncbi:MAG: helix-turn-helix domain-containing protein, partial [Acidimicrobiaceae bacterium]|nr:helix-turn-helix domain-containing protein [Acidimicrobiaceae bacterium]